MTHYRHERADALRSRGDLVAGGIAVLAGCVPALSASSRWLGEHDSVNFALALERFDLAASAPHFPGYPVYVALAKLAHALGAGPTTALALPGAILLGLGAAALVLALRRRGHRQAAWLGLVLAASTPLWVITGSRPLSDATGAGLVFCAFGAALSARPFVASMLAGALAALAVGARPSLWPVIPAVLLTPWVLEERAGQTLRAVAGVAIGGAAWALPLLWVVGPETLTREAVHHVTGHFGSWGNTAWSAASPWSRGAAFADSAARALAISPLARGGIAAVWLLGLGAAVASPPLRRDGTVRVAVLWAALYAGWILVGQNPEHPRHLLPLAGFVALLAGMGLLSLAPLTTLATTRTGVVVSAAALLAAATILSQAPRVALAEATLSPPPREVARWIAERYAPTGVLYYGGSESRLLARYLPALRIKRLSPGDVSEDLRLLGCRDGVDALLALPAHGDATAPSGFVAAARFDEPMAVAAGGDRSLALWRRPLCPAGTGRSLAWAAPGEVLP